MLGGLIFLGGVERWKGGNFHCNSNLASIYLSDRSTMLAMLTMLTMLASPLPGVAR